MELDEDNMKTRIEVLSELHNKEIYISLKMDGSSMTIIYNTRKAITYYESIVNLYVYRLGSDDIEGSSHEFLVCSRNFILTDDSTMAKFAHRNMIKEKLMKYGKNLAIQGKTTYKYS